MGANPKTTLFLKECLADALIQLLETKPIEKITVPEIASLAGVGRTTYFRNFSSKREMLSFKLTLLWERWTDEHNTPKRSYEPENALDFFRFNYSIRPLLSLMYSRDLQTALYGAFGIYLAPLHDSDLQECYESSFYSYGLFGLLDEWIAREFRETPEQMARIVREMFETKRE